LCELSVGCLPRFVDQYFDLTLQFSIFVHVIILDSLLVLTGIVICHLFSYSTFLIRQIVSDFFRKTFLKKRHHLPIKSLELKDCNYACMHHIIEISVFGRLSGRQLS
jgi:hypothetical protein